MNPLAIQFSREMIYLQSKQTKSNEATIALRGLETSCSQLEYLPICEAKIKAMARTNQY